MPFRRLSMPLGTLLLLGCGEPAQPDCEGVEAYAKPTSTYETIGEYSRLGVVLGVEACDADDCAGYPTDADAVVRIGPDAQQRGIYELDDAADVEVRCDWECVDGGPDTEEADDSITDSGQLDILSLEDGVIEGCFTTPQCGSYRFMAEPCVP